MALILTICIFGGLFGEALGSAFRGIGVTVTMATTSAENVRATMLSELMAALGNSSRVTEQRLAGIEEAVRPMFLAMPKNEHNNLDHSGVRYLLHRLFVHRHRMFVKGLEPGRVAENRSSPTEVLDDRVPEYVQGLFEERLGGRGLGIHELAVLAATLEHLIHDEAIERLKLAYKVAGRELEKSLSLKRA